MQVTFLVTSKNHNRSALRQTATQAGSPAPGAVHGSLVNLARGPAVIDDGAGAGDADGCIRINMIGT